MCNKIATTMEHVPPKCLFPEEKDIGEDKYRKNLITVPSCEEHNNYKSHHDEFLMVSIAGVMGNNSIGYKHSTGKVKRAVIRSSNRLLEKVFLKKKKIKIEIEHNKFHDVIIGTPDIQRLEDSFSHIAYGIYYHHFQEKFNGEINIIMGFIYNSNQNAENFKELIKHKFKAKEKDKQIFGKNKDVFYYQFVDPDENGLISLKLCFYEWVDIYIAFIPTNFEAPFNLGHEFIKSGMKTFVEVEGKKYEFN